MRNFDFKIVTDLKIDSSILDVYTPVFYFNWSDEAFFCGKDGKFIKTSEMIFKSKFNGDPCETPFSDLIESFSKESELTTFAYYLLDKHKDTNKKNKMTGFATARGSCVEISIFEEEFNIPFVFNVGFNFRFINKVYHIPEIRCKNCLYHSFFALDEYWNITACPKCGAELDY